MTATWTFKTCTHPEHKGRRNVHIKHFSKHPSTKDGLQSICKECNRRIARARAIRKREERRNKKPTEDFIQPLEQWDYHEVKEDLDYKEPWNSRTPIREVVYESESEEG